MQKIVFFEIEKWEEEYLNNSFEGFETIFTKEKLNEETVLKYKDAEIISAFIYSTLTREVLEQMLSLKFIATRSMGYDHIDTTFCKEKSITVSFVPSYGAHTVAEHTFALILAISRKIVESVEKAKKGEFKNDDLTGFDLYGKTLGVIGTGHIGQNVAELGLAFGMRVLAFSHHEDSVLIAKGVKFMSLDEVLGQSDIVTLHLPHTKETEHTINIENISKFKKGAILINTARGVLVETQAIVEGLEKGILLGAGLDVLEEEAELREERELLTEDFLKKYDLKTELLNHVLLLRPDVIVTPHNAFNSKEALIEIISTTIDNVKGFINKAPINTIE